MGSATDLIQERKGFMITLHLNNLRFSHGGKEKELTYDFVFSNEQPVAIQGESGVGKTTFLDLIAGFLKPYGGEIYMTDKGEKKSLAALAYLRQDAPLFDHLSVQKNIAFSRASPKEILETAEGLGVADLLQKKTGELSGGQRQRVLLAQTLLQKRPLVLLDEPFKGLDQENKERAVKVVKSLTEHKGQLLIFTTHDEREIEALGGKKVLL